MIGKKPFFGLMAAIFVFISALGMPLSAQTWQSLGPKGGNATGLVRDPQNRLLIYALLSPGGVYKSLNGGASWTFASQGIPTNIVIGGLAVDPIQTTTLYAAAGLLYKSTDGGAHWNALPAQPFGSVKRIFVSPNDSSVLIAGTDGTGYYSLDGGATWSTSHGLGQIADAVFDPLNAHVVYMAIGGGGGLYRSPDNGATWTQVSPAIQAVDLSFDPGSPSVLYAVVPAVGIYRTANGGADWTIWNENMDFGPVGYQTNYLTCFAPGPAGSGYYYAGTEQGLYRSTDNGAYWGFATAAPEYPATNALLVDPTNKEIVLAATSPLGIFRSIVVGTSFSRSSDGIDAVRMDAISLAISPANPARIVLGTSLGFYKSDGRGGSWSFADFTHYINHIGRTVAAHPTDASIFATGTDHGLFRSADGGSVWTLSYPAGAHDIGVRSLIFDPFQPVYAYAGSTFWPGFYKSTDGGASWAIGTSPQGFSVRTLAADPSQEGVLYAGLGGGWPDADGPPGYYLAKSPDRGATWAGLADDVIYQRVNSIVVDPSAPLRLYAAAQQGFFKSEDGGAAWRRITGNLGTGEVLCLAVDPQSPHHLYAAAAKTVLRSTDNGETWSAFGTGLPADDYVVLAVDPSDSSIVYAGSGGAGGLFRTGGADIPVLRVDTDVLNFGVFGDGATSVQSLKIFNGGTGTLHWTASLVDTDAPFVHLNPTSGTGNGSLRVTVDPAGLPAGGVHPTLTIKDPGAQGSPKTIRIQIKRYNSGPYGPPQPPFGHFDTPADGSTVMSSIAVTGWALDDIEVTSVKIYRNPVGAETGGRIYIGDATFVEGARPEVETIYLEYPFHRRAGWGYMMLTNFLPNGGNGTFTIYAYATDKEGHEVQLGSKTITCDNANAVKPFGAIDLPAQGETISGAAYINGGWALTPPPNAIPTDGSTLTIWVDSIWVGRPLYNQYRGDIATLFPGYANSNGAVGVFTLNTTSFTNGVHTIEWSVRDNAGNEDGIGSRYISILNTGTPSPQAETPSRGSLTALSELAGFRDNSSMPIYTRKGFDRSQPPNRLFPASFSVAPVPQSVIPRQTVIPTLWEGPLIVTRELERLEILLDEKAWSADAKRRTAERAGLESTRTDAQTCQSDFRWEGYLVVGEELRSLPIGSTLDASFGIFSWLPGPGFLGDYRLVFVNRERKDKSFLTIRIEPRYSKIEE